MFLFLGFLFKRLAGRWPWTTCDVQHAGVWMDPNDGKMKMGTTPQEAKKKELPLAGLRDSFYDRLRSLGGWPQGITASHMDDPLFLPQREWSRVVVWIASFLALPPVLLAADSVASTVMVDQPSVGV